MGGEKLLLTTEEIIDRYADMVYRIAVNEMGNKEDAEDVFQDVFLRLVRYRDRISTEEHLKAWLIRVTVNCSRKRQGSAWKKRVVYLNEEEEDRTPDEGAALEYARVESGSTPVGEAVGRLPEIYRIVVYLFYYEEMSVAQIGKILGEKESTVKSRLHRAREMLKIGLEGEDVF